MDADGRGEENDLGVEGGETVIRIYCVRGKNLFSIRVGKRNI